MTQAFDVLGYIDNLLQVLVLPVVKDRIVNNDAINRVVPIRSNDAVLYLLSINFSKLEP